MSLLITIQGFPCLVSFLVYAWNESEALPLYQLTSMRDICQSTSMIDLQFFHRWKSIVHGLCACSTSLNNIHSMLVH